MDDINIVMEEFIVGEWKKLFVSPATDEEINIMNDNARSEDLKSYYEYQLEQKDIEIKKLKEMLADVLKW